MKCRICNNENNYKIFKVREMMFGTQEFFPYFQCSACNCLQIKDIPLELFRYYPVQYLSFNQFHRPNKIKKYFTIKKNAFAVFDKGLLGKLLYPYHPNPNLRSLHLLSLNKDLNILDVGCGLGSTLFLLKELGFSKLSGIDPFIAKDIEYGNGLKIVKKEIQEVSDQYDLIMFHHSFEHLPDPVGTLNSVTRLLSPGGHCLIRIPIIPSYAWEHYGVNWVQLDAPRHLFLHSVESIRLLARQSGLDMQKVEYDSSSFQFWGSEQYLKGIPLEDERSYSKSTKHSIFSKKEMATFKKKAKELNKSQQGDQAAFYLVSNRKK